LNDKVINLENIMPSVGPTLPPARAEKRKRDGQDEGDEHEARASTSPNSRSTSLSSSIKKARTIGPTLPPASLDERPANPPESDAESSSDDDDFGPSLPTGTSEQEAVSADNSNTVSAIDPEAPIQAKSQRDEWMIVPPTSGDWTSRVDPTKLKNRKFNTGRGAKGPSQAPGKDSNANWTETPDEKKARLQREMMGVKDISTAKDTPEHDARAREIAKKLREYNVSSNRPAIRMRAVLTDNRKSREELHFTRSTKRPIHRRKKMIQAQEPSTGKRILLEA
jgi:Protein of unknown function (DUF3752)